MSGVCVRIRHESHQKREHEFARLVFGRRERNGLGVHGLQLIGRRLRVVAGEGLVWGRK